MSTRAWSTLATAAAAAALALTLGALQSVAWHGAGEAPTVARWLTAWLDPGLLLQPGSKTLDQPSESYFGYGRLAVAIYVLLAASGLALLRTLPSRLRWTIAVAFVVAAIGDVVAYWISESAGPDIRRIGFWYTEVPALLVLVASVTGAGVLAFRRAAPGRALAACLPLALVATAALAYLPHGPLLGIALTIVIATATRRDLEADSHPSSRRATGAIALLLAAGIVMLALMYRPVLREGPVIEAAAMPAADALAGARLHVFNTGYNRMSWLLVGRENPWRPVPAFVIEDPESGLFVFDTGFSDAVARQGEAGLHVPERWVIESRSAPSMTLPEQMRAVGLDPARVHHVAISHMHGDHTGQLDAFGHAAFIGGAGSASSAATIGGAGSASSAANIGGAGSSSSVPEPAARRWREERFEHGTRLGPFDDAVDVAGDPGIVLIRGGGHAREGLMLLLALEDGPVLLAGDAVVHGDWLRSDDVQRIPVDPDRAAVVRNEVRAFVDEGPGSTVAYGHDLRGIDCSRRDIVCHRGVRANPEELDTGEVEALVADFVARRPE